MGWSKWVDEGNVQSAFIGNAAVIAINAPPLNLLSGKDVIRNLANAIDNALMKSSVGIILVRGFGICFSAGLETRDWRNWQEFNELLDDLISMIEAAQKPMIATMHGVVMGAALELSLAFHYRFAALDTILGFPDFASRRALAGTIRRLPRLVGVASALDMLLGPRLVSAEDALQLGLVDRVGANCIDALLWQDPRSASILPRACDRRVDADPDAIDRWRERLKGTPKENQLSLEILQHIQIEHDAHASSVLTLKCQS